MYVAINNEFIALMQVAFHLIVFWREGEGLKVLYSELVIREVVIVHHKQDLVMMDGVLVN